MIFVKYLGILYLVIAIVLVLCKLFRFEGFENKKGIERVDGIIYINLENRPDRKILLSEELNKINIDIDKTQKVAGVYRPKNGHKGCVQSHILGISIAKMNQWKNCLILEDDAELTTSGEEFQQKLDLIFDYLEGKEWDVIMLATANADKKPLEGDIKKVNKATTGSAYIINHNYYDTLKDLFEDCNSKMGTEKWGENGDWEPNALDQRWHPLQEKDNWFGFETDLIKQRAIWSTTNKKSE